MTDPSRLFDPATAADRWPVYDELRSGCPLQIGRRSWVVISHDHVRQVLNDPASFSSDVRDRGNPVFRESPLVFDDPPRHTPLRRLVISTFTPRRIAAQEPWVRGVAAELLDALAARPADFVAEVANPLPVRVIAHLLGVPPDEHEQLKRWSEDRSFVTYHGHDDAPRTPELLDALAGCEAMYERFRELLAERRNTPTDDLLSALLAAEVDGHRLTEQEIVGIGAVLLTAGNLTTSRLLSNLAHLLATDDRVAGLAATRPDTIPAIVDECLRRESPLQYPIRKTAVDAELGGVTIPAGHTVLVGIGPANRDPGAYERPDEVDIERSGAHLAFGQGIHFCAGAALARLEGKVVAELLTEGPRRLALDGPAVPEPTISHCGFERLPVRFA
ncbi:MAG: cytochrome P450 [Acidimicrobiales bacterium]|nr:cytochrome P450 [Acidimicrobiales bacterium]